jgi:hypothetical protein
MTSLLTVPVIGKDIYRCGHPKTEENSIANGREGQVACRICKNADSRARYARNGGRNVPVIPLGERKNFCVACLDGDHHHAGGCLSEIRGSGLACRCGVSWPVTWRRELRTQFNNVERVSA